MSHRGRVVIVCPNDLVVDTRGQKMAASLARTGFDVVVVARASDRAPHSETADGVQIIRVEVPRVAQARQPVSPPSTALLADSAALGKKARQSAYQSLRGSHRLRSRARLALSAGGFQRKSLVRRIGAKRAFSQERRQTVVRSAAGPRAPWPHWRELLQLPLAMDQAFWPVIEDLDPDIIHCHDLDGLVAAGEAARRLNASGRTVRLVYDAHENWAGLPDAEWIPDVHNSLLGVESEFIAEADIVMTVSDEIAETIQRRYGLATRPLTVLNTPSARMARPAERNLRSAAGLDPEAALMVYSGSISHSRRVPDLIRVLPLVPSLHLVVVSVPYPHKLQPEFEALAEATGVADRVHVIAPVPAAEVVDFLSVASFGVHPLLPGSPNHEMALPNKLFEYLHARIPIVTSNCRAMMGFVRQHDLGRDFVFGDLDSLANAITQVLEGLSKGTFVTDETLLATYSWESQELVIGSAYSTFHQADPSD